MIWPWDKFCKTSPWAGRRDTVLEEMHQECAAVLDITLLDGSVLKAWLLVGLGDGSAYWAYLPVLDKFCVIGMRVEDENNTAGSE